MDGQLFQKERKASIELVRLSTINAAYTVPEDDVLNGGWVATTSDPLPDGITAAQDEIKPDVSLDSKNLFTDANDDVFYYTLVGGGPVHGRLIPHLSDSLQADPGNQWDGSPKQWGLKKGQKLFINGI